MRQTPPNRAGTCVKARTAAAAMLAIAALALLVKGPSGCGGPQERAADFRPAKYTGVPSVRVLLTSEPVARAEIAASAGYTLSAGRGAIAGSDRALAPSAVALDGDGWRVGGVHASPVELTLECRSGRVELGGKPYRGSLRLLPVGQGRFIVVNHLDMESYLAGVLARELYPNWSVETYRAQAIAARTFAMYQVMTAGKSADYDLGSTQASQVYGGASAETQRSWQAVRATHGQVLAWGSFGHERIFLAQYSSCCGGRTNPASVIRFAEDIPPLRGGQVCTGCAASSRYRWGPVRIRKTDLYTALGASYSAVAGLGGIAQLKVASQNEYGRIVWVDVIGPNRELVRLRAEDVRLSLLKSSIPAAQQLYSANCSIRDAGHSIEFYDGRGYGHGVGMCQWGAEYLAANGASHEQILSFYYPQAKIFQSY